MSSETSVVTEVISVKDGDSPENDLKNGPSGEEVAPSTYMVKPPLQYKFRARPVKQIIKTVLTEQLQDKEYSAENAKEWTKSIANVIRDKVRELNFRRYKLVVQVHLGEQKGAGVQSGIRCLWDSECDNYTSEVFLSETIFCLAAVYAVYYY